MPKGVRAKLSDVGTPVGLEFHVMCRPEADCASECKLFCVIPVGSHACWMRSTCLTNS
jgi:hypothetical protein